MSRLGGRPKIVQRGGFASMAHDVSVLMDAFDTGTWNRRASFRGFLCPNSECMRGSVVQKVRTEAGTFRTPDSARPIFISNTRIRTDEAYTCRLVIYQIEDAHPVSW